MTILALWQIALLWGVKFTTVRTHYARACTKLGVTSRRDAIERWQTHQQFRRRLGLCMTSPRSRRPD